MRSFKASSAYCTVQKIGMPGAKVARMEGVEDKC